MKRFQRGEIFYPFANGLNYTSGPANGFATKITPAAYQGEGLLPDQELPAEFLNYFFALAANHANAELDTWFHSWQQFDTVTKQTAISARMSNGATVCNNVAEITQNTVKYYTDIPEAAAVANVGTTAITPAAGNLDGVAAVMSWDEFVLICGANTTAPTKCIWRTSTGSLGSLTELTVTGAVAADFQTDNTCKFVRDPETGYLLLYTSVNDKAWRSTDDGATWTATAAPGRVGGGGYKPGAICAANGYVVIADTNAGQTQVELRILTESTHTWASVTVDTYTVNQQEPVACNWSDTLQRWLIMGAGQTTWMSDTTNPAGTYTEMFSGTFSPQFTTGLILDNVFCGIVASVHTTFYYSIDFGANWRASKLMPSVAGTPRLEWDGAAMWALAAGAKFRTALRAPAYALERSALNSQQ